MFRAHHNKRLFFTQPMLSFFDGDTARFPKSHNLAPGNYAAAIEQHMRDDWTLVPQPRPPRQDRFLFVKNGKVFGRLQPPHCVPFPRRGGGGGGGMNVDEGGITKKRLLEHFAENDGTWFLCCTERAVGVAIVHKDGSVEPGSLATFQLLVDAAAAGAADYDDPGYVRPGAESPMFRELFSWIDERQPRLEQCANWVARRDWPDLLTFNGVREMRRRVEAEQRVDMVGGGDGDASTDLPESPDEAAKLAGHEVGTAEATAAAAAFAAGRRTILEHPKWRIVPPYMMPDKEVVRWRSPNQIEMLGAIGRLRQGKLELL